MKDTEKVTSKNTDDKSLKGTFASVLIVAAVIVVMWAGIFLLYMERV